ncbi:DNA polymerase III subunit alpha [Limibacillus sp. MBR-115]|jgi:DNA polymerase-3 subunit alpha|uniref:DNA polymerase III subunit alpha n=1 Tax=Limibacillus sp. MBR-115 TaxID=3156465 RepID=UPI00339B4088
MSGSDFIHLRVHSAYSLSEGAIKLKPLVERCRKVGMPAVGVTDTGNLFGALEFSLAATAAGIQPIIGCQLWVTRSDSTVTTGAKRPNPDQLVLLVKDEQGYRNLMRLSSRAYLETDAGETPQVDIEALEECGAGLIALTGGAKGPVNRLLNEGRGAEAEAYLLRLKTIFNDRLYIEIQRHGIQDEVASEPALLDLAYRHDLPLVATNDCYFLDAQIYEAHDALLCIAGGAYVTQEERRRMNAEYRFKSAEEMRALFEDLPEAVDNSVVVAQRCAFFPETINPILPAFPTAEGRSEAEELRAQAEAGLHKRLEDQILTDAMSQVEKQEAEARYRARLDFELDVIGQMGFPGYFLIVADFIQWAKGQGIPVGPGRGSGAGSLVAYALTITDLDPLRWNLLFERFLNPERVSMPDFDIDFCQDRRDEVIRYVQKKYGYDTVAQIITFGKLQARAVLRDVGRVLQMPYPQVDRICKMVPNNPANPVTLAQAVDGEPQLQVWRDSDEQVAKLIDIGLKLEGLYRHASTHAAGVVIGDRPLTELVPLYRDPRSDMPVTQFNMKYVEQAGLVKFDFLGLKTLTVLSRACQLLEERGVTIDLSKIPLDDSGTFEMLGRGDTVGVFQLESSGMRDVLKRLKADRFEDIIAVVALYRPGPMDNIPHYIARKHGQEKPDYLHPSLEGILKETFGIMIYQEQVMQIAQELAGYSLGSADMLRRAMGKKIQAEMDAQREFFVKGAKEKNVDEKKASDIFDLVAKFAGYGFNKSHAAAYALVAYQTAYLKANYPVEFLAASMTYDMSNTDKLAIFRQELDRQGIPFLPPDINRSRPDFAVEDRKEGDPRSGAIRYALAAIKNVGGSAMAGLVQARETGGPFKDITDFAERLDNHFINKRAVENLACAGAFDGLEANRRRVYQGAETIVRHAAAATSERASSQESLFDGDQQIAGIKLPAVDDWPAMERLASEFNALGFYLSAHPLDSYNLERLRVVSSGQLQAVSRLEPGRKRLAGIVVGKRELNNRKGQRMAFVQFSDLAGVFEVTLFSEVLAQARDLLDQNLPLLITANVETRGDDEPRITAHEIELLDQAMSKSAAGLRVYLRDDKALTSLHSVLSREGRGRSEVSLVLTLGDGREVEMGLPGGFSLSAEGRQAIKAIPNIEVQDL